MEIAEDFGLRLENRWIYLVDSQEVTFPNPIHLIYLRMIKRLPDLKAYVIYVPTVMVRLMILIVSLILKPELVLKTETAFTDFKNSQN